jgi:hypothetical protein
VFQTCLSAIYYTAQDRYDAHANPTVMMAHTGGVGASTIPIERWVAQLVYELPLAVPGVAQVKFRIGDSAITSFLAPNRSPQTATFPLWRLFNTLSVDNVLCLLSAILCENRILFHSASMATLTVVTQCLFQMLYPFKWWYPYIPTLTSAMVEAHAMYVPPHAHTRLCSLFLGSVCVVLVGCGCTASLLTALSSCSVVCTCAGLSRIYWAFGAVHWQS